MSEIAPLLDLPSQIEVSKPPKTLEKVTVATRLIFLAFLIFTFLGTEEDEIECEGTWYYGNGMGICIDEGNYSIYLESGEEFYLDGENELSKYVNAYYSNTQEKWLISVFNQEGGFKYLIELAQKPEA